MGTNIDGEEIGTNNKGSNIESIAAANMATTSTMDYFIHQLRPEPYRKGEDIELFIKECEKFFAFSKIPAAQREMIVMCLLERNLVEAYESIDKKITDYKERLRKAFGVETTLLQNIKAIFSYRMTNEKPEKYFAEIKKLVEKFFDARLTKENLEELLLIECYKERDLKRDLCINDIKGVDNIQARIKKLHEVESALEDVMVIERNGPRQEMKRSYRDVARHTQNNTRAYKPSSQYGGKIQRKSEERQPMKRSIVCWSCHKEGHVSRQCPERTIKCFACGDQGHIRRKCPRIHCKRCSNHGHLERDCYTNLNRQGPRRPQTGNVDGTGAQYGNVGHPGERRYYGNRNRPEYRKDTGDNQGRYVANMEESREDEDSVTEHEYPKDNAPTEVETVGALH